MHWLSPSTNVQIFQPEILLTTQGYKIEVKMSNIQVSSDPYIKLQILPEKEHKVKTRVLRNTVNPVYDEDFTFYGVHFNRLQVFLLHTEYNNSFPVQDPHSSL